MDTKKPASAAAHSTLNLPALPGYLDAVMDWLEAAPLPETEPGLAMKLQLVAEELFLNVAHHAYVGRDKGEVRLALFDGPDTVVLQVEDDGLAFDPLSESASPDLNADLDDRPIGGMGVHLVRNMSFSQSYARTDGVNRLSVVFRKPGAGSNVADVAQETNTAPEPRPEEPDLRQIHNPVIVPLLLRVILPIGVILTASLMLAAGLNVLKLQRAFQDAAQIRFDSAAREVRDTIERSFGEGLSLASNFAVKVALDRSAALYDDRVAFYVSDLDGTVVYTSAGAPPMRFNPQDIDTGTSSSLGHSESMGSFLTSVPLVVEGGRVGTLTLAFAAQSLDSVSAPLTRDIARAAPIIALFSLPFLGLIAILTFLPLERRFHRLARDMKQLAEGRLPASDNPKGPGWRDDALVRNGRGIHARLESRDQA